MANMETIKYLIIGNSAGGIGAAEAVREVDTQGSLGIISEEPYHTYSRPLISEYLAGKRSLEQMHFRPADLYRNYNIQTYFGRLAERLDLAEHTVELYGDTKIKWEKLLLATGGTPIVPRITGANQGGVFTFTTLDDARSIEQFLPGKRQAVVVGGGLIGVSVTEALVRQGIAVTIVEMQERVLSTILDEESSVVTEETMKQHGVSILTGRTVTAINDSSGKGLADGVTLDDGSQLSCELVVIAIGVTPRLELVADTGIKVNRGILVDRHMATSVPDVYACGDVAEAYDFVYQQNRVIPIWPDAYIGGRVAGFNMAGVTTEYAGATAMSSLKYFGLDMVSAGMVNPPDDGYEVISNRYDHSSRKVIIKDGVIVGMTFAGDIDRSGIVFNLMKNRVNVDNFKSELVASDFGLASLPEALWRPQLEVPPSDQPSPSLSVPDEAVISGQ